MNRFFYEKSVVHKGHLIIPFVFGIADEQAIYSYRVLSELGHHGKFHQADNPSGIYSDTCEGIIAIAKEYLDINSDIDSNGDYFKRRYTYRNNLIIIHRESDKYFYDHYKPKSLNNIAAPKIFETEIECISWIKQGLDRSPLGEEPEKV